MMQKVQAKAKAAKTEQQPADLLPFMGTPASMTISASYYNWTAGLTDSDERVPCVEGQVDFNPS